MHEVVDPVVAQYRTVARGELTVARDAMLLGEDAIAMEVVAECLTRVLDMAAMLRHRRTTSPLELLLGVVDAEIALGTALWDRSLDALERLVMGGRPDPRVSEELEAIVAAIQPSGRRIATF